MPHLEYRIGENHFLGINGEREPPKRRISLDERPGVDGTEATDEGNKGRPFTLRTYVDAPDYETAWDLYIDFYKSEIGRDPVELVVGGISSIPERYRVLVLDVRVVFAGPGKLGTVGGINPPSEAWLECDWDLIAIPI